MFGGNENDRPATGGFQSMFGDESVRVQSDVDTFVPSRKVNSLIEGTATLAHARPLPILPPTTTTTTQVSFAPFQVRPDL